MGGNTSAVKRRNTIEIQWQIRANGKHQVRKVKGRAMDTMQYGRKPRTPEPIPIAGKLTYTEEAMGHWTPTGVEPRAYDDIYIYTHNIYIYIIYNIIFNFLSFIYI